MTTAGRPPSSIHHVKFVVRDLEEHGEGFFLLSLAADELVDTRLGILDWRVKDLGEIHGALMQLTRK